MKKIIMLVLVVAATINYTMAQTKNTKMSNKDKVTAFIKSIETGVQQLHYTSTLKNTFSIGMLLNQQLRRNNGKIQTVNFNSNEAKQ